MRCYRWEQVGQSKRWVKVEIDPKAMKEADAALAAFRRLFEGFPNTPIEELLRVWSEAWKKEPTA